MKFHSVVRFSKKVFVLFLAVVAVAVAIPAAIPQPSALSAIEPRQPLENREIDPMSEGAEPNQDLKGSSSYGHGFYGPYSYGYYGSPYYYHRYGLLFKNHSIIFQHHKYN